jgi:hypothetical protein
MLINQTKYDTLILSSGGTRGYILLSALNELNKYTDEINELSKHNFKKIIKNMINEKYIIDINNL